MNYTHIYDLVAPRKCSECKSLMHDGYCIEDGHRYYCKEECLHKNMTQEEYLNLHDDGEGDSYWTEWELHDVCTDDIEIKLEELANVSRVTLTEHQLTILNEQVEELEHLLKSIKESDEKLRQRLQPA